MTPFGQPPFSTLEVEVRPPEPLDLQSGGPVRLVSITGGRVSGGIEGMILPGGTDWQMIDGQGNIAIEARYLLELTDGTRVELQSRGQRAAQAGGFWSSIWLRTESANHASLNAMQFVAMGRKLERHVAIEAYDLPAVTDQDQSVVG
jgi:Protein of unknown function (DUF3237)